MRNPRRRFRKRRSGGFLVIAASALVVLVLSHPAVAYLSASLPHLLIFTATMVTAAAVAGVAWAFTTATIESHKNVSLWKRVAEPRKPITPKQDFHWQPYNGQVVEAEVIERNDT